MEETESLEDLAMSGKSKRMAAEKAERKKRKHLEKIKRMLKVDDAWDENPIEASEIEEVLMGIVGAFKDPLVKSLFKPKDYKMAVNSLIDAATATANTSDSNTQDLLAKV